MRENQLSINHLIYPMFVTEGNGVRQKIQSMPGISRQSIDQIIIEASECFELGIPAIALFPVIDDQYKSESATESFNPN